MKKENYISEDSTKEFFAFFFKSSIFLISVTLMLRGYWLLVAAYLQNSKLDLVSFFFILTTLIFTLVGFYLSHAKQKYHFKNHRFFFDIIGYCFTKNILLFGFLIPILISVISIMFDVYFGHKLLNPKGGEIRMIVKLLSIFTLIILWYTFLRKKHFDNIFPISHLAHNKDHSLVLIANYNDFIDQKIDNPSLIIGQDFLIKIHEHPRNEDEKNTVLLINQNTTPNPSIVTVIINKELADGLRNDEFILKTELKLISEFTKLEIALWIDRKNQSL